MTKTFLVGCTLSGIRPEDTETSVENEIPATSRKNADPVIVLGVGVRGHTESTTDHETAALDRIGILAAQLVG